MQLDAFSFAVGGLLIAGVVLIFLQVNKPRVQYVVEDRLLDVGWDTPIYTTSPWRGWRSGYRHWNYGPSHISGFTHGGGHGHK